MGLEILEIETATPHPGVTITGRGARRETNGGWVTLRSRTPLSADNHQWAVRVVDHGEGNDGSGLMLGLLPPLGPQATAAMGSKYISELGGWCLSRAGDFYGNWKCDKLSFSSGCVVEFDWDAAAGTLYIVCGKRRVTGQLPPLADDDVLYPAFSMYYLNQQLTFV